MEFDVPTSGLVVVTNVDHDSVHSVNVSDGVPVGCSCPADTYQPGACKHRVAVAMAAPLLEAASVDSTRTRRAMADGGTVVSASQPPELDASEGCPHGNSAFCEVGTGKERPEMCWDCFEESRA